MQRLLFTIILFATLLGQGCKKLDEETFSVLSSYSNETEVKAAVTGMYQTFFSNYSQTQGLISMLESGNRYSTFGEFGDTYGNTPYYDYTVTPQEATLSSNWKMFYKMINNANEVMVAVPEIIKDQATADAYIGEARFLRGWAYFMLTQLWGEVPLHLEPTRSLANTASIYKPRSPISEVYNVIVADLEFAKSNLPNTRPGNELGRATKAAAMGMLGKVYLTMAGKPLNAAGYYQKAADELNQMTQLVNNGTFNTSLLPKYEDVFSTRNEMNNEVLVAFRGSANSSSQSNGTIFPWIMGSHGCYPTAAGQFQAQMYGLRWDIMRLFEKNGSDVRLRDGIGGRYASLSDPNVNGVADTVYYDTATFVYRMKSNPNRVFGFLGIVKIGLGYTKWKSLDSWIGSPAGFQKDWIVLRYADVLLCLAEALNETNQPGQAMTLINQVRQRSGASACPNAMYPATDQASVRQLIKEERVRELIGEGTSITDIRRWGTLQSEMAAFRADQFFVGRVMPSYNAKFELYPVPFSELSTNPLLLPQNTGW